MELDRWLCLCPRYDPCVYKITDTRVSAGSTMRTKYYHDVDCWSNLSEKHFVA